MSVERPPFCSRELSWVPSSSSLKAISLSSYNSCAILAFMAAVGSMSRTSYSETYKVRGVVHVVSEPYEMRISRNSEWQLTDEKRLELWITQRTGFEGRMIDTVEHDRRLARCTLRYEAHRRSMIEHTGRMVDDGIRKVCRRIKRQSMSDVFPNSPNYSM